MKKTTNLAVFATTLLLTTLNMSCASLASSVLPTLDNRKYDVSPAESDNDGVEYWHKECVKKLLGICIKSEMKVEYFDFKDKAVRQKFRDMGFRLVVSEKIK